MEAFPGVSYASALKKNIPVDHTPFPTIYSVVGQEKSPVEAKFNKKRSLPSSKPEPRERFHFIDAGLNITHKTYSHRIQDVLRTALKHNCRRIICISTSVSAAQKTVEMVRDLNSKSKGEYKLYCTVGVHPHSAQRALKDPQWITELERIISANRDIVVAVGECGLDYDRKFSPPEAQIACFIEQIRLAQRLGLPLYLHERDAHVDFLQILDGENHSGGQYSGLVHCFTGNAQKAQAYVSRGLHIGITGWICDKGRSGALMEALSSGVIPRDRFIVETDGPYLTPKDLNHRPMYNGSHYIPHITGRLVDALKEDFRAFSAQVVVNTRSLFGIE